MRNPYLRRSAASLKAATSELVQSLGGVDTAARFCRVVSTTLHRYTSESPENLDRFIPVDVVAALESKAGIAPVTEFLAENSGYLIWKIPSHQDSVLEVEVARMGENTAAFFADWVEFITNDGIIDKKEAEKLLEDNTTIVRTLMRMRSELKKRSTQSSTH